MELTREDLEAILDEVRAQSGDRNVVQFGLSDARRIGAEAAAIAERESLPVVISVFRGEQRAFHAAFDGTTAEHDDWVRRKFNTAIRHDLPSLEIVLRHRISGRQPDWLDPLEFAVAGGAVPIVCAGNTVGVLVVSGLVGSIRADHDLAMRALRNAA